jgi:23S rRNA (adenine2503-C2)-methyltransferase
MKKTNLKALSKEDVERFFKENNLPAYRARQLLHWIYERGATDIGEITEFSKPLREDLSAKTFISSLMLRKRQVSEDGTEKFLFELEDGGCIESVLIPDENRLTLCISSQVGCRMGCEFCLTGETGFVRDLLPHEIVDQYLSARRLASPGAITNIVFMGMGEPLNNLDNVAEAIRMLTGPAKFSKRRITVSTSGVVPRIPELPKKAPSVNLAVSLNATTDEVRSRIMPINRKHNIQTLLDALRKYPLPPGSRITIEYVLLRGVNDTGGDARRLVRLLKGIPCKINLIPFNEYEGSEFKAPDEARVLAFQKILTDSGMTAIIRKSKGRDILAACGQLRAGYA